MADLEAALAAARSAAADVAAAGERAESVWTEPRAPGKWSPSQVIEHVSRTLEESAKSVQEAPSAFPSMPGFVRPIARTLFFRRTLKKGGFSKAKTFPAFDPKEGPPTPAEGRARLERAFDEFARACHERSATTPDMVSTVFGTVSMAEYIRFQELHLRHHQMQIPGA